jgi:hypothetical protein
MDGYANQAEGQQEQPYDRVEEQRKQCQGPAEQKQKAP